VQRRARTSEASARLTQKAVLPNVLSLIVPVGPLRQQRSIYPAVIPRGALIVAGRARRAGWRVTVFDAYSFPETAYNLTDVVESASVVGISVHGAPSVEPARRLVDALRVRHPSLPVLLGGNLANVAADLLQGVFSDCLVYEGGADAVLRALDEVRVGHMQGVFRMPVPDADWELPDIDALHIPFERYLLASGFEYQLPTQVGCPFRCFHCGTGRRGLIARVINRPSASLRDELDLLTRRCARAGLPTPSLWITDETFTSTSDHARSVIDVLRDRPQFRWRAQTRADSVDAELLHEMRGAGCHTIAFGVEVPTDAGMKMFGKREAMERVEFAFRSAREAGLRVEAILVFGAPEDQSEYEKLFDILADLAPDSLQSYLYHPVPGSPWWRQFGPVVDLKSAEEWSKLDFHSPLIVPGSYEHQRDAIGRFLSSLVWSPDPTTDVIDEWRWRLVKGFVCPHCFSTNRATVVNSHAKVDVLCLSGSNSAEILLAVGTREIVAYTSPTAGNVHRELIWVTDLSFDTALSKLCLRCGILPEFSKREAGEIPFDAEVDTASGRIN